MRYVACSERGSEPPSPPGFSFFPFVQKKYFFSVSPLYFQKETRDIPHTSGGRNPPPGLGSQGAQPRLPALSYGPNELAANWAPAMVETALMSADTKLSTEKLPPGSRGVVTTSKRLAQS